ncbi:F0F1 ATP synthase subunit epsilon [Ferviditalea candida]|uniref:ATP synthase epsilon chain n=1 Tax=Ferviditalea candida TaxID=3108399 RepID=A0ABU5ZJ21_9BACL|nr:F0F1 ATP synthase subunit epsilon [Paenibacillaceae bacterium T2]
MSSFILEIVTPERKVYEKEAEMVVAKGVAGEMGILANHIPLVTPLKIATVKAKRENGEELIAVHGGFMEVRKDRVVILAETAELPEEIDVQRALAAKERAENRLSAKQEDLDYRRAEIALQKALTRIKASGKSI